MIDRITLLLGCVALVRAVTMNTYFTPATTESSASYPIHTPPNPYARPSPAPIYEEDQESKGGQIGTQHSFYQPIGSPISYNHYRMATPIFSNSIYNPYNQLFNTQAHIVQNGAFKTTLTHSDAPSVSHTKFTGFGTVYAW